MNDLRINESPKFPTPNYIIELLDHSFKNDDKNSLEMAKSILEKLYKSGIFDHIGYGFFMFSDDENWLIPKFEKTLYDNALLATAYTKVYEITNISIYKEIAEKTYEFILRDLQSEEGGFYSGIQLDFESIDGAYYLFEADEIIGLLGEEWGGLLNRFYDITKEGNYEGKNIPNLIYSSLGDVENEPSLNSMVQMLFTYREKRKMPQRHEKINPSWNELIIESLTLSGKIFNNEFYIKKAVKAAEFIQTKNKTS